MTQDSRRDLELLLSLLRQHSHRWVKAHELTQLSARALDRPRGWDRRYIAALVEASAGHIIGNAAGYRLQETASDEDVTRAYTTLMKRAKSAADHAAQIMRYFHSRQRAPRVANTNQTDLFA